MLKLPDLSPLPAPPVPDAADGGHFRAFFAADFTSLDTALAPLDSHLADAAAGSKAGQVANAALALDIASGASELLAMIADVRAVDLSGGIAAALAREAAAENLSGDAAALSLPPDFSFDVFDLGAPPSASGLASLPLPGQTPPPTTGGGSTPPFIFVPITAAQNQIPSFLAQGSVTLAGVVGTLFFVADAFLVFNYLTSYNFAAALAAYDAATKAWALADPIGFGIWQLQGLIAPLQAAQLSGVGGNAAYQQRAELITRYQDEISTLRKVQYTKGV